MIRSGPADPSGSSDGRARRIALVPSAYLPDLGGVEELTRHLALAHRAAGCKVEVWTGVGDFDPPRNDVLDGIDVRRVPMPLPAASAGAVARFPVGAARSLWRLRRAVEAFRPDVLHVQCFGPNGIYATVLSAWCRVPLVVTLQGETVMDDTDVFDHSVVMRRGLAWSLGRAAVVTGCSRFTVADAERRFGLRPDRGVVVPNGVVVAQAEPPGVWTPLDAPYLLALGRVVEKKGFDLLLRAYAAIPDSQRTVDVVLGGTGAALDGLRSLAFELGITGQVHFVGRLSREEVSAAMAGARLFVLPSRVEPFGIVILEAWRAGVPVVATRYGGPFDLIEDGEDGVLVDPFATEQFSRALVRLLGDRGAALRIGARGKERVASFDWTEIAAQYRELYSLAAGDPPSPRDATGTGSVAQP